VVSGLESAAAFAKTEQLEKSKHWMTNQNQGIF